MNAICAVSKNYVIGNKGTIPWHWPVDLRRFSYLTRGRTLYVGSGTVLPDLPGRNVVRLTRDMDVPDDAIIIGGAKVFANFSDRITEWDLSIYEGEVEGDTLFPFDGTRWRATSIGPFYHLTRWNNGRTIKEIIDGHSLRPSIVFSPWL